MNIIFDSAFSMMGLAESLIKSGYNSTVKSVASNIADAPKLNAKLTFEEANSIFTESGSLKPEIINNSKELIPGSKLGNQAVKDALTSNGSSIDDWAKMTTETFKSPSGNFQIHYYMNLKTGEVSTYDMKAILTK